MADDKKYFPYYPEIEDVYKSLINIKHKHFKSIKDNETDSEAMYIFIEPDYISKIIDGKFIPTKELMNPATAGVYIRDESEIKRIIKKEYIEKLEKELQHAEEYKANDLDEKDKITKVINRINYKLKRIGVKNSEIKEIMQKIRVDAFVDRREMNPDSHIPLKSGLLNIKTWQMEEFNAGKFYTYKVLGNYNPDINSLNQIPRFRDQLLTTFPSYYAVTVLDYFAYCYYTSFPMQKVLMMAGIHRRGKGTLMRIISYSMPDGFHSFELEKLLNPDNRFGLQGIEGKKVLVDTDITRDTKRSISFSRFNRLFGGDTVDMEEKNKISRNIVGKFAGILIGNTPLFYVKDSAFLSRLLIVVSEPNPIKEDITYLDKKIWEAEGDKIVAYLLNRLKALVNRGFKFTNQMTYDEYANLWNLLSDSVKIFADEKYTYQQGAEMEEEQAYAYYKLYCSKNGIIAESKHEFARKMGKTYPLKRARWGKNLVYVFTNCAEILNVEIKEDNKKTDNTQPDPDELGL
jgi:phage/plasmid-associated DNA primase